MGNKLQVILILSICIVIVILVAGFFLCHMFFWQQRIEPGHASVGRSIQLHLPQLKTDADVDRAVAKLHSPQFLTLLKRNLEAQGHPEIARLVNTNSIKIERSDWPDLPEDTYMFNTHLPGYGFTVVTFFGSQEYDPERTREFQEKTRALNEEVLQCVRQSMEEMLQEVPADPSDAK